MVTLLLEYFESQADCIALQVGQRELEVSLLGSYATGAHDVAVSRLLTRFRLEDAQLRPLWPAAGV